MAKKKIVQEVENPWKKVVDLTESLYISIDDQYKISPKNELSTMLSSVSLIVRLVKNEYNVWESRK
jgi:hypothetical protein